MRRTNSLIGLKTKRSAKKKGAMQIKIKDIVPDGDWMDVDEGKLVYERILPVLKTGESVELSFEGGTLVLTAFLNGAIGQLYAEFDRGFIRSHVTFSNALPEFDLEGKFYRVEVNSINYYAMRDKERCNSIVDKALES